MGSSSRLVSSLALATVLLSSSGCMAIIHAPKFLGGTRGWINIAAGEKHWVARRAPRPYALASGSVGLGDMRPFILPFAIFDFVPSLALDLLLLPISIPHSIRLGMEKSRADEAEERRLEIERERQQRHRVVKYGRRADEDAARRREAARRAELQRRRQESRRREPRERAPRERAPRRRGGGVNSAPQLPLRAGSSEAWVVRHNAAREALAEIARAQALHQEASPSGEYSADLNALLARGTRRYRLPAEFEFRVQVSGTNPTQDWMATASPRNPRELAARWFAVDSAGVVKSYSEPFGDLPWDCTLESLELQRR